MTKYSKYGVLRQGANWKELIFYKKTDVLYQLTVVFCRRFLPPYGDRTVDQMIQAARSGKQNIVEGSEDGKTSTEMELRLLNVARSSIGELHQDYQDYLAAHQLQLWTREHPRFQPMLDFCKAHADWDGYQSMAERMPAEDFCNTAITLCHQVDAMMNRYLQNLEKEFVTQGGIKERMHKMRTGYRQQEEAELHHLRQEVAALKAENNNLKTQITTLQQQLNYYTNRK